MYGGKYDLPREFIAPYLGRPGRKLILVGFDERLYVAREADGSIGKDQPVPECTPMNGPLSEMYMKTGYRRSMIASKSQI
jgi:hypothetical protein